MKATEIAKAAREALLSGKFDYVRVNFANGDMVGHTGDLEATKRACKVVDQRVKECRRRGLKVVVAGIPKTIDNDIDIIDKSFGFDTAVEEAQRAINSAHVEAESVHNGIGLVKLMVRYSGYIAMHATLASRDVDLCLIPEVPFFMSGPGGLIGYVRKRLRENGHMIIVVAEGAGLTFSFLAQDCNVVASGSFGTQMLLLSAGFVGIVAFISTRLFAYRRVYSTQQALLAKLCHMHMTPVEDAPESEEKEVPTLVEQAAVEPEGSTVVEERDLPTTGEEAPVVSEAEATAVAGEEAAAPDGEGLAAPIAGDSAVAVEEDSFGDSV